MIEKQNLFVPLGVGLQTDVDDKLLPLGKVTEIENAYVLRTGELIKRFGTTVLPDAGVTLGPLGTHLGAMAMVSTPMLTLATPASTAWAQAAGDMRPGVTATLNKLATNAFQPDVAYGAGYVFVVYIEAALDTMRFLVLDAATGHRAFATFQLAEGGTTFVSWHVVYCNGRATMVALGSNGRLYFAVIDPATFAVTSTTSLVGDVSSTYEHMDAIARPANDAIAVAYRGGGNTVLALDFVPSTLAITNWVLHDAGGFTIACALTTSTVGWIQDVGSSNKVALITVNVAQGLRVQWNIPTVGATRTAAATHTIDGTFTAANHPQVTGNTLTSDATGSYVVAYDSDNVVRSGWRFVGVIATSLVARNAALRSKTWTYTGSAYDVFAVVANNSLAQGTCYVVRIPYASPTAPQMVAKIGVRTIGLGAGLSAAANLPSGQFVVGIDYTSRFDITFNPDFRGIELALITHPTIQQTLLGVPREAIGSMFVPGGALAQFDGALFQEAGFAYHPDTPAPPAPSGGGNMTAASTYWYVLLYSYMDAQGRLWRSAGSVPVQVTLGGGDGTATVACPTLRITGRQITIEVYRGAAGDARTFQKTGIVANSLAVDTVNFVDTRSDLLLAAQEFLYTNGGVLNNDVPPGFLALVEAQNRTWGISADDNQVIWYTKEHVVGKGMEHSEAFTLDVRDKRGPMRALSQMDGRPIVFKDDAVYEIAGRGPDVIGAGGSYAPLIVCDGIGCNNPQAICETKDGVLFRSTSTRAGFFLLDRGLSVTYVGGAVQRYNGETITASAFLATSLQARFYTASGRTLVYDLVTGIWTTFTSQPCNTAVSWNGTPVYMANVTGHILYEDATGTTLTDDGVATTMLIGGPWVQVNQVRGFERYYRQQLVGEVAKGAVTISMAMYRDYLAAVVANMSLPTPVGIIDRELRYSAKLAALKTVITDSGSTTGILKVSGLALVLGTKQGLRKVAPGSRFV
jgi:hypothetical protein